MVSVQIGPVAREMVRENLEATVVAAEAIPVTDVTSKREVVFDQPERLIPDPYSFSGWSPIT